MPCQSFEEGTYNTRYFTLLRLVYWIISRCSQYFVDIFQHSPYGSTDGRIRIVSAWRWHWWRNPNRSAATIQYDLFGGRWKYLDLISWICCAAIWSTADELYIIHQTTRQYNNTLYRCVCQCIFQQFICILTVILFVSDVFW